MEHVAIEHRALALVSDTINSVTTAIDKMFVVEESSLQGVWIENSELIQHLSLSLRTLQSYRERRIIGYSLMGRKIYYRRSEVDESLQSSRITQINI